MSNLVEHAKRELALAGNDEDYNECIIKTIEAFTSYPHSGSSAEVGISILNDLLRYRNLTALTNDPAEWNEVGPGVWQSSRNSEAFSNDKGRTYTLNYGQPGSVVYASKDYKVRAQYKYMYKNSEHPGLVVVDAVHIARGNEKEILHFLEITKCPFDLIEELKFLIGNPDGPLVVNEDEWLILGNSGEFFSLSEAEFDSTYESLNPESQKD